jgi:alpha-beta hydrolase superfamily lysophospholipase
LNGNRHPRIGLLLLPVLWLVGCATPYVQPPAGKQLSPALYEDHALMEDGYRLPLSRWQTRGEPRAALLALHGLNDYRHAFASTGASLTPRGIEVIAYDQRGFGDSAGPGLWHGSARLAEDLRIMIALLRAREPARPLYLLGESMGAAVVLAAADRGPLGVDGVILAAPAVWSRDSMPRHQRWALWLMAHLLSSMKLTGEGLDLHPSDNIAMLRALGRDPRVIKATRVDVLYGVSNLMDRAVRAQPDLPGRTLVLYGRHDDIIPRAPTCRWLCSLGQKVRTLIYRDGYHMLTRDLQAEVVVEDITAWIGGVEPSQQRPNLIRLESFCPEVMAGCLSSSARPRNGATQGDSAR